jgi:hypothetical protein
LTTTPLPNPDVVEEFKAQSFSGSADGSPSGIEATSGGITNDSIFSRRFDEAARTRNVEVDYDLNDRLSVSGFAGPLQDNYNHAGGVNNPTPLNFIAGTADPFLRA